MTEIKKATIDDVDVSKFKTRLRAKDGGERAIAVPGKSPGVDVILRDHRYEDERLLRGPDGIWSLPRGIGGLTSNWARYFIDVADEFDAWLKTELARIDREREEAARPKWPTVKAPEGYKWEALDEETIGFRDKYGCEWVSQDEHDRADPEHSLMCELSIIKARAEALGKRIVVLEDPIENLETRRVAYSGKEL